MCASVWTVLVLQPATASPTCDEDLLFVHQVLQRVPACGHDRCLTLKLHLHTRKGVALFKQSLGMRGGGGGLEEGG